MVILGFVILVIEKAKNDGKHVQNALDTTVVLLKVVTTFVRSDNLSVPVKTVDRKKHYLNQQ